MGSKHKANGNVRLSNTHGYSLGLRNKSEFHKQHAFNDTHAQGRNQLRLRELQERRARSQAGQEEVEETSDQSNNIFQQLFSAMWNNINFPCCMMFVMILDVLVVTLGAREPNDAMRTMPKITR